MSEILLEKLLSEEIDVKQCVDWLQNTSGQISDATFECSKADFVTYFIAYLKNQTESILQFNPGSNSGVGEKQNASISSNTKAPTESPKRIPPHREAARRISTQLFTDLNSTPKDDCSLPNNATPDSITDSNLECKENNILSSPEAGAISKSFVTPIKNNSAFNSDCILSPVTPIGQIIDSSNSVGFSTPNNSDSSYPSKVFHNRRFPRAVTPGKSNLETCQKTPQHFNNQRVQRMTNFTQNQSVSDASSKSILNFSFDKSEGSDESNVNGRRGRSVGKKKKQKFVNLSMDDAMFSTGYKPKTRENRSANIDLRNHEVFPDINENSDGKINQKRNRRINPTRLNNSFSEEGNNVQFGIKQEQKLEQNEAFRIQNFQPNEQASGFNAERNILKMEKEKLMKKFGQLGSPVKTPAIRIATRVTPSAGTNLENEPKIDLVKPDPDQIFNVKMLNILSDLYNVILDCNLVLNLTSEVYFLVSLIVAQQSVKDYEKTIKNLDDENTSELKMNQSKLLLTVHDCVYFGLATLDRQTFALSIFLDRATLRLLCDNDRVKIFLPHFSQVHANNLAIFLQAGEISKQSQLDFGTSKNVCFMAETDCADNFPNHMSFQNFKKQRDLFYEILRKWEANHETVGWNFRTKLSSALHSLFSLSSAPHNMLRLSGLFKEQLLATCLHENKGDMDAALAQLRTTIGSHVSQNKLSKLAGRLTAALPGQTARTDFPNHQEFFRDFILYAESSTFREHLIGILVQEIYELNDTDLYSLAHEDKDNTVDQETRQQYLTCVKSLCLLGKFLGFTMSLPYSCGNSQASIFISAQNKNAANDAVTQLTKGQKETLLKSEIALRNQIQPAINLKEILETSLNKRKLVLTIPWTVQLMAMLDYVALRLKYFKDLIHTLFDVYAETVLTRNHGITSNITAISPTEILSEGSRGNFENKQFKMYFQNGDADLYGMSAYTKILLRLSMGWLFELPQFPQDFFYLWLKERTGVAAIENFPFSNDGGMPQESGNSKEAGSAVNAEGLNDTTKIMKSSPKDPSMDSLQLVTCPIMVEVCPFLRDFRAALQASLQEERRPTATRHITPLTSSISLKDTNKELQGRLEEWFLRSQSLSTRRVVQLVGERVGAALVRSASTRLTQMKELLRGDAHTLAIRACRSSDTLNMKQLQGEVCALYARSMRVFSRRCVRAGRASCRLRTSSCLQGLLPSGLRQEEVAAVTALCRARAITALQHWLIRHCNTDIFYSDLSAHTKLLVESVSQNDIKKLSHLDLSLPDDSEEEEESEDEGQAEKSAVQEINFDETYHSALGVIIELKDVLLAILTGALIGLPEFVERVRPAIYRAEVCSRCSYIDGATKKIIAQLTVDLTVFTIAMHPTLLDKEYLSTMKLIWNNTIHGCTKSNLMHLPWKSGDKHGGKQRCKPDEDKEFQRIFSRKKKTSQNKSNERSKLTAERETFKFENGTEEQRKISKLESRMSSGLNLNSVDESEHSDVSNISNLIGGLDVSTSFENDLDCSRREDCVNDDSRVDPPSEEFFSTIICSRNVMILGQHSVDLSAMERCWDTMAVFLDFLLKNGFLREESLTDQLCAVYRQEWPEATLKNLANCMKKVSQTHTALRSEKFNLFLEFMAEFCLNLDQDFM